MTRASRRWLPLAGGIALVWLAAGCATRGDLLDQERRFRSLIIQQNRSLQQVKREVERLRGDIEEGRGPRRSRSAMLGSTPEQERMSELEEKVQRLESGSQEIGMTVDPNAVSVPSQGAPVAPPPVLGEAQPPSPPPTVPAAEAPEQLAAAAPPPTVPPPPPTAIDDEWRREVAQDEAVAGTIDVPERTDYLDALQGLSHGDCRQAGARLRGLSDRSKGSPLADNALYWQARCHAADGNTNQAVTEFYDVVTRYPKSDKAPAALWQQGLLFLRTGNTSDARLALSKLIKDYPASTEASRARQKLAELEQ
jgi:TolA-binding protein